MSRTVRDGKFNVIPQQPPNGERAPINEISNVENLATAGDLLNPSMYKTATDARHFKIVQARRRTKSGMPAQSGKSRGAGD